MPPEPLIYSVLVYKKETKLHMIRIRFGTFSVDRITKSLRANMFDKLSHFGGTAGLFNGFTIISVFEFLGFGVSMLLVFYKLFMKKDQNSNNRESQVIHSTANNEIDEDIWIKKLGEMETKLNLYKYKMTEGNQMLEEFENKMNEKMEKKKVMIFRS